MKGDEGGGGGGGGGMGSHRSGLKEVWGVGLRVRKSLRMGWARIFEHQGSYCKYPAVAIEIRR